MDEIREQLRQAEDRLRALREEKARSVKLREAAKSAYAAALAEGNESEAAHSSAMATVEAVRSVDAEIEKVNETQVGLLKRLGDLEAGKAGFTSPGANGWAQAARTLDLDEGIHVANVSAASLLQPSLSPSLTRVPKAATSPSPLTNRYVYPVFESKPVGGAGDLATTDFTISFTEDALTGVEIAPATDTPKQELPVTVGLASPSVKTFAIIADDVPARLFDSQDALRSFLSIEMARRLDLAYDAHVVTKIEAASPPTGSTGANLVAKIRNAIAAHRELGSNPRVLALTPEDAASLDLSVQPGSGDYVFRVDIEGTGSPVWSLAVREVPTISDPTLIDPVRLGLTYLGEASVLTDPYGENMRRNRVSTRVEAEAVFHVRHAAGAYVIA